MIHDTTMHMQSFSQHSNRLRVVIREWHCGSGRASGLCLCLCAIVQDAWNTVFESCTGCRVCLRQMIGDELIGAFNMGSLGL